MLIGPAATSAAVLAGLADAAWVHFGCHATSDPREPSGGLLHLPGGDVLTVRQVSAGAAGGGAAGVPGRVQHRAGPGAAPGQAIHLANAFLLAGFSAAVGTLWEVDSADALTVAFGFYTRATEVAPQGQERRSRCTTPSATCAPGTPMLRTAGPPTSTPVPELDAGVRGQSLSAGGVAAAA